MPLFVQKPTIVVVGATGPQGRSCINALVSGGNFAVMAMTRDASSEKARDLASRGVEVVAGDLDNKRSLIRVPYSSPPGL